MIASFLAFLAANPAIITGILALLGIVGYRNKDAIKAKLGWGKGPAIDTVNGETVMRDEVTDPETDIFARFIDRLSKLRIMQQLQMSHGSIRRIVLSGMLIRMGDWFKDSDLSADDKAKAAMAIGVLGQMIIANNADPSIPTPVPQPDIPAPGPAPVMERRRSAGL